MLTPIELLNQRIDILEKTYIGIIDKNQNQIISDTFEDKNIIELLNEVNNKYNLFESKVPSIKVTYELITKLRPIMIERKDNLTKILQKIEFIILNKEILQQNMKTLSNIKELNYVIDSDCYKDIESLQGRLDSFDQVLNVLIKESHAQSSEIDELLDIYEKAMKIISEVCCNWENELKSNMR